MQRKKLIAVITGCVLTLTGCSATSSIQSDALFANFDIKPVKKIEVEQLPALNLSGPEYKLAANKQKSEGYISNGSTTTYDYSRLIIVGDSRACGMYTAVSTKNTSNEKIVYSTNNKLEYFICKVSQGFSWFSTTASNEVKKNADNNTAVVVWLGVNDIAGGDEQGAKNAAKKYADKLNQSAKAWNSDVYALCVTPSNPTSNSKLNKNTQAFNRTLEEKLDKSVTFLDNYDKILEKLKSGEYKTDASGIHYQQDCYRDIYSFIKSSVGSIGNKSADNAGDIDSLTGLPEDAFFFTKWESGQEGYAQAGGDNGKAYGKYQFDYRYSAIPFAAYCYTQDKENGTNFYKKLHEFRNYSTGDLAPGTEGSGKFTKAWKATYEESPKEFKAAQDAFAYAQYYQPVHDNLVKHGIDVDKRADVIKGVLFSYSIQHGSLTAANNIKGAVNNAMSDAEFIKAVYSDRMNRYPAYSSRYTEERDTALKMLK